jgi:hypothetical protein
LIRLPGGRSLSGRLALLAVAVATLWLAVLTALFNLVLAAQLRAQADGVLRTRALPPASGRSGFGGMLRSG